MTRVLGVRNALCQLRLTRDEVQALHAYATSARLSTPQAICALIRAADVSDCDWQSLTGYDRPRHVMRVYQAEVRVSIPEAIYDTLKCIARARNWSLTSVVRHQLLLTPTATRTSSAPMTDSAFVEIVNRLAEESVAGNGRTELANEKLRRSFVSGAYAARQLLTATREANK